MKTASICIYQTKKHAFKKCHDPEIMVSNGNIGETCDWMGVVATCRFLIFAISSCLLNQKNSFLLKSVANQYVIMGSHSTVF